MATTPITSNDLIDDIRGDLLKQGISLISGNLDIPPILHLTGESVKPAILPNGPTYLECPDFHATWCNDVEEGHLAPCEGEWHVPHLIPATYHEVPIKRLTMAMGANGDVFVEIAWNDFKYANAEMYPEYAESIANALNDLIMRVLATIRHNRLMHA